MILLKDEEHSIPFVREMLVESLTRAGMKPWQAHSFSKSLENELLEEGTTEIGRDEFAELVHERLKDVNESIAQRFKAWRELQKGDKEPMIILLGGGTGAGTTTVGTEVAYRMGIKNIISTDSVREIMRKTVSDKLLPALHSSSYDAYKNLKVPIGGKKEAPLMGFRMQVTEVSVGIEAIIERALKEGTPTLIEGLHVVPGFISEEIINKDNVMMFVLHIKDSGEHKNRLYSRAFETKFRRSVEGYMENFDNIRNIQKYIKRQAGKQKTPTIENKDMESSVVEIMDRVIEDIVNNENGQTE
jgi:2-phosphoglycerate kinase